ncbi:MAG: SusC/RagA family TonB-linked outer membrane protein [Bacteroidetes bacterium]|nr:MAG: SusC/RagA family TonB-linked outer membrane protein [Bacteroidota bacterium]
MLAMAQQKKTFSGIVRDDAGNPLPGITVQVKGTKVFGVTDVNGAYSLSSVTASPKLIFTGVGFATQEIDPATTTNVAMVVKANELNEVVVTGFGQRKATRNLTYAVQEVKGEEIARAGQVNIVNSLQGKVAGVMINQGAGGPSSSSRIRIRGNASLSGNTMPLVVIDGILLQPGATGADSWGDARDFGNQMKNLSPDDYESLTVLKGSAASALYGSQAINGVILITTKKGKERPGLGVSLNQTNTIEQVWRLPALQNQFGAGIAPFFGKDAQGNDALILDGSSQFYSFGPRMDGRTVTDFDGLRRPFVGNDLTSLFRTGRINNTNVAIEGGSDKTTFRFSYTNTTNEAIQPTNKFTRNNFNLRASQKVGKFITMDASIAYATSNSVNPLLQGGNSNPIFRFAFSNVRNLPIDYVLANYLSPNGGSNIVQPYLRGPNIGPLWQLYQVRVNQREDQLLANLDITAKIRPWLTALVRSNVNALNVQRENRTPGDGVNFGVGPNFQGSYSLFQSNGRDLRVQGLLTANRKIGEDFDYSITVGAETNRGLGGRQQNSSTNGGLRIPRLYNIANSINTASASAGILPQFRLDAVYGYGDITWRNMVTLTGSLRNDWDSRLTYPDGRGNFTYLYPSLGASFVFTELMEKGPKWLNFGKLRASYGVTGGAPGIFETTFGNYGLLENAFILPDGTTQPRYGLPNTGLGNLNLAPLRAEEFEVGLDTRLFDNRIRLDVAYYKKNTRNQVLRLGTPSESGASNRIINAGNIQNQGIEMIITGTIIRKKDFEYSTTINYTRNRNKILSLTEGVNEVELDLAFGNDVRSVARVGKDYGTIITNFAYATDPSGNKLLNASGQYLRSGSVGQGFKELGTMMERFLATNIHELRYKNFNLFIQMDAKIGGMMASATHQYGSQFGSFESTLRGRTAETGGVQWTDAQGNVRNDGMIPNGVFNAGTIINGQNVGGMSYAEAVQKGLRQPLPAFRYYDNLASWGTGIREYSVFENSWVAMREVSFGYEVPKSVVNKIRFQRLRVNLIGRNLFYLYNTTPDNINPESIFSSRAGAFAEYGGMPWVRQFSLAINAGF